MNEYIYLLRSNGNFKEIFEIQKLDHMKKKEKGESKRNNKRM